MERVPRVRAQNQEMARANAAPGTETADPRAGVAADKAGQLAKEPDAVRVEDKERDRNAVGNLKSAAAVGGYIMLPSPRGGTLATPWFIFFLKPKFHTNPA